MASNGKNRLVRAEPRQVRATIAKGPVRALREVRAERIPEAVGAEPPNRPSFNGRVHVDEPPRGPWDRELVKAIAMDIGKDVVAYVEVQYPKAIESTSSTFKLSLRNCIFNEIMAAIEVTDEGEIRARLRDRKKFRREWTAAYRKIRRNDAGSA